MNQDEHWKLLDNNVAEVDVLAVMKSVNPDIYGQWGVTKSTIEGPMTSGTGLPYIRRFHLHVQEGMVVVGLKLMKRVLERQKGGMEDDRFKWHSCGT